MSYWFARLKDLDENKYPAQIAYLREEHGFSQAHANAVVMSHRGSSTSKRFTSLTGYLAVSYTHLTLPTICSV